MLLPNILLSLIPDALWTQTGAVPVVVECTFGILTSKWRILKYSMQLFGVHAVPVMKAMCPPQICTSKRLFLFDDICSHNIPRATQKMHEKAS